MNDRHLERALLLFQQNRFQLAEQELRQSLAANPEDARAHALLALCFSERKLFKEATDEARQAIHLAPDISYSHYAMAHVLKDRNRYEEALVAVREAIRIDPYDADYCGLEAAILLELKNWPAALEAAERGLEADAEHLACTNLRAIALVNLGRKSEAGQSIDEALAHNPEDATTHANQGWTLLHRSEPKKALEHFREALRLDPTNEWARAGIVEALKARNIIYALMLKYFLFMAKLSPGVQWLLILGGVSAHRILARMAESNPELAPWVLPVQIVYIGFVLMTWLAYPLFNLLLRLNRFGRMVLTREQIVESNWVGAFASLAIISLVGCIIAGFKSPWLLSLTVFGLFLLPLTGLFRCSKGWPRTTMMAASSLILLLGLTAIWFMWQGYSGDAGYVREHADRAFGLLAIFALCVFVSSLLANLLASRRPQF